ncbi:hypothetical protein EDF58_104410 [Novosphingobium sp. PhB57]|nr:hypothetical protein EDF58_104410 [Novosphingobium sp. PhB57]
MRLDTGMTRNASLAALAALAGLGAASLPASAQPADLPIAAADGSPFPPGVRVRKLGNASVYTDAKGKVLYGLDMRTLLRWAPDPARFCNADCAQSWTALAAPAGSTANIRYPAGFEKTADDRFMDPRKAPDWTVIDGAQGKQWVYKGWHLVFTRAGAKARPADRDGADGNDADADANERRWNTLKYVPPPPKPAAPGVVTTAFVDGAYAFADREGRVLFTGKCERDCAWRPLPAPMASSGLGEWKVSLTGDEPEWTFKGKRVFVGTAGDSSTVPSGGQILRP